jgi:hypothetical protein
LRTPLALCLVLAAAALAACDAPPEDTSKDDVTFFEEAVASIGCTLVSGPDYNTVQFQADLTRAQALALAGYELGAGRAERLESGGIRLTAGPCAPGAEPVAPLVQLSGASA